MLGAITGSGTAVGTGAGGSSAAWGLPDGSAVTWVFADDEEELWNELKRALILPRTMQKRKRPAKITSASMGVLSVFFGACWG
jgi:hypothetical protein